MPKEAAYGQEAIRAELHAARVDIRVYEAREAAARLPHKRGNGHGGARIAAHVVEEDGLAAGGMAFERAATAQDSHAIDLAAVERGVVVDEAADVEPRRPRVDRRDHLQGLEIGGAEDEKRLRHQRSRMAAAWLASMRASSSKNARMNARFAAPRRARNASSARMRRAWSTYSSGVRASGNSV